MAWKNIKQSRFADAMLIDHHATKERDGVSALISWSRVEKLMSEIHCSPPKEENLTILDDDQGLATAERVQLK